jgi:hypothetical protein
VPFADIDEMAPTYSFIRPQPGTIIALMFPIDGLAVDNAQVFEPGIGARTDKHTIALGVGDLLAALESMGNHRQPGEQSEVIQS